MNFASNSPKPTNYPHRPSYYPSHTHSPHHTARTPFNSHGPAPYHPRLITTPTPTTPQPQPQPPPQHTNPTHNHIKKNYHFSAKSSELFIKKKSPISNNNLPRNTRFDAMPTLPHPHSHTHPTHPTHPPPPHAHVQLLTLTRPTISFSSQHTPQSFIANTSIHTNTTPNNSPHTLSTVSTTSPSIITNGSINNNIIECKANNNKINNQRKSRWNSKPEHMDNKRRDRDRSHRTHIRKHSDKSHSRSRSRSRTANSNKKNKNGTGNRIENESEDIDMSISDTTESFTPNNNENNNINNTKYIISKDIHIFPSIKYKNNTKRNYAKEEIHRKQKRYTTQLKAYMLRNTKRKRKKNIKKRKNITTKNNISDHENSMADDECDIDINNMTNNYNIDINNSDFAIYEPPFKKPKFMKKVKAFVNTQSIPKCVVQKITKINNNLLLQRNKKRKQREEYILVDRAQSNHWNLSPTKCWFYRCVHMLEGHVSTMCSSPEFAGGVSYPLKPLNEIEKKLSRIHPLPSLIYKRLFKTLYNLSHLIRTYPSAVKWDKCKLESIFKKAIRKQQQMKGIYNFNNDNCGFIEYDFTPFKLPEYERNNVSFYLHNEKHADKQVDVVDKCQSVDISGIGGIGGINGLNRATSIMSMTVDGGIDDDEEEENDDEDEGEEDDTYRRSNSVTPSDIKDLTPTLSLSSNQTNGIMGMVTVTPQPPQVCKDKQEDKQVDVGIKRINNNEDLMMETQLNMDLVRKTKVTFHLTVENSSDINGKFQISPKIERLVKLNVKKIELKHKNVIENLKKKNVKCVSEEKDGIERIKYTWKIETLDSSDENICHWLKEKKKRLKDIFFHNGVYGPIKGIGLEPTYYELPTYQYDLCDNLNEIRLPSIYYLISNYVDSTNPWYIKMLLKYFDIDNYRIDNIDIDVDADVDTDNKDNDTTDNKDNNDNANDVDVNITRGFLKKYLCKHPKALRHTFIGTSKEESDDIYVYSTVVMEMYVFINNKQYYIRMKLNETKRHKLLCVLLRIKNKHKYKHHTLCIPQPPPPPIGSNECENKRILLMNTICVNYNWNGFCEATYCNKKHECCSCGDKHPARICSKQCIDYNWAKCQRICPKNKQHICSQCGDNKHPAWRCQYLHKSVTERYYAIYKTKKLRNGYFKLLEKKEKKKNIEWINRRYKPYNTNNVYVNNGNTNININTNQIRHQIRHHPHNYQNNQKGKKRSSRK